MDNLPLSVLHEDADLVAIAKPPGLLVHPSALDAQEERSALKLLRDQRGERLWPLHRLDKATSGVLVFARHPQAASEFGRAFEEGRVSKRYLALVRGWPPERGAIEQSLARDPEQPSQGQERIVALTRFERLACFEWPFQADARHAHIAHPLVGDTTHGKGAHNRAVAQWLGASRLWLHCEWMELPGRPRIVAPPGPEWAALLAGVPRD